MAPRVQSTAPVPGASTKSTKEPFKALLEEARRGSRTPPGLKPKGTPPAQGPARPLAPPATQAFASVTSAAPVRAQAVAAAASQAATQQLSVARAHHVATADQLAAARLQHHETSEHQVASRVIDLIVKELVADFDPRTSPKPGNALQPMSSLQELPFPVEPHSAPQAPGPASGRAEGPALTPEVKAAQAVALIERIETFVRSQRPALALTLNNALGARVEIEKLGPGRIALKLVGQNGPPAPETVSRIREELRARGLTVGALSVG